VPPSEVVEAALAAGLHGTSTVAAGRDWSATRLVAPKSARR
jgi:nicotinic acid phosphoribosyltransferase